MKKIVIIGILFILAICVYSQEESLIPEGDYRIINRATGKSLSHQDNKLLLIDESDAAHSIWNIRYGEEGAEITNKETGARLDAGSGLLKLYPITEEIAIIGLGEAADYELPKVLQAGDGVAVMGDYVGRRHQLWRLTKV